MFRFRLEGLVATVIALALLIIVSPANATIQPGWTTTGSMGSARYAQSAVLLNDGRVLVAGGVAQGTITAKAEVYNPANGTWSPAASMVVPRVWFSLVKLNDGTVLASGGQTPTANATATAEIYYPAEDRWRAVGNMTIARSHPSAVMLYNAKVLVAGGIEPGGTSLGSAELFDPATNSWVPGGMFAGARYDAGITTLTNGTVLLAGGAGSGSNTSTIYSPDLNTWTTAGNMVTGARTSFSLTALTDGRVLASGGNSGGTRVATAGLFDPTTKVWSAANSMISAHDAGTATQLAGGTVLEVGGVDASGNVSSSSEVYDPRVNQWNASGALGTPRYLHTATPLPDGRVLVAGGYLTAPLASAEIFTPTTSITADPAATFPDTATGAGSSIAIQVRNSVAGSSLLLGDFALSGANPGDFGIAANGCYGAAPGASCSVIVQFDPSAAGLRTAALTFGVNTAGRTQVVSLSGRGVAPSPPLSTVTLPKIDVKVVYLFKHTSKRTWFQKLEVTGAPKGSTITVTCAKGCAKKKWVKRNSKGAVSIRTIVSSRHIKVGRSITVVVGHTGYIAAVKTIKIRKKGGPLVTTRCLPPGAKKSVACSTV